VRRETESYNDWFQEAIARSQKNFNILNNLKKVVTDSKENSPLRQIHGSQNMAYYYTQV